MFSELQIRNGGVRKMSKLRSLGQDFRARRRPDLGITLTSQCTVRPMTAEEKAWIDSLPKPNGKPPVIKPTRLFETVEW